MFSESKTLSTAGWQCVVDLYECQTPFLNEVDWVRKTMLAAARVADATVVGEHFHAFAPHGISGVVIIGESHLAIHIWPERRFAAVDVFTCNAALKMRAASNYLVDAFQARRPHLQCMTRGSDPYTSEDVALPTGDVRGDGVNAGNLRRTGDAAHDDLLIDEDTAAGGHWFVRYKTIASVQTHFQRAEIVELAEFGRALILDDEVQSVEADEYIYHEALVHPALCLHSDPRNVLIIGGGEGAVAREVLKHPGVERVVMVDIDADVVALAQEHLGSWHKGVFCDPRLSIVIGDGYDFVQRSTSRYDVIIVDVVSSSDCGPAQTLYERNFYRAAKKCLGTGGTIVIQGTSCNVRALAGHRQIRENLSGLFDSVSSYATYIPSFLGTWGFVLASDACDPRSSLRETIDKVLNDRGLPEQLRFYDGRTHLNLFELPKDVRALLGEA